MDYQLISECQSEAIRYYDEAIELIKATAYKIKEETDMHKIKEASLIILQAAIQAQLSATEAIINSADDHNPESEIEPRNLDEYRERRAEDWAQFGYSR